MKTYYHFHYNLSAFAWGGNCSWIIDLNTSYFTWIGVRVCLMKEKAIMDTCQLLKRLACKSAHLSRINVCHGFVLAGTKPVKNGSSCSADIIKLFLGHLTCITCMPKYCKSA